jgi:hypothetical protein
VPLIRAMLAFFGRRMAVHDNYYSGSPMQQSGPRDRYSMDASVQQTGLGSQATAITWMLIVVIALPVIVTIILIGLIYEVFLQVDGARRLDNRIRWGVSGVVGILLAAGFVIVARDWVFTASLS